MFVIVALLVEKATLREQRTHLFGTEYTHGIFDVEFDQGASFRDRASSFSFSLFAPSPFSRNILLFYCYLLRNLSTEEGVNGVLRIACLHLHRFFFSLDTFFAQATNGYSGRPPNLIKVNRLLIDILLSLDSVAN